MRKFFNTSLAPRYENLIILSPKKMNGFFSKIDFFVKTEQKNRFFDSFCLLFCKFCDKFDILTYVRRHF